MHRSHAGSIAAYSTVAHPPTQIGTHPAQPIESSQYWSPRAQAHLARLPLGSRTGGGHSTPRAAADGLGDERADAGAGAEEGGGELDAELVRADEGHGGRGRRHRTVSRRRRPEAEPRPRAEQSGSSEQAKLAGTRITTVGDFFSGYPCHWQVGPFPRASLPDDDDKQLGFWS